MKYFYFTQALIVTLIAALFPAYCSSGTLNDGWTEVKNQEGIRIYTKKSGDSSIVVAKGIVTIAASPDTIIGILDDNINHTKWMPYLSESRKLEAISDQERLEYNLFDAPWPASDRDFVFRVKAYPDEQQDSIVFKMRSEPSPLMPDQDGIIRGTLLESKFRLIEETANKTRVELLFQADPKGWIPLWVVNIVQRAWPFKVLKGLREQATSIHQPKIKNPTEMGEAPQ